MIGLYPLSNATTPESTSLINAFLASASEVIGTTLPNSLLLTPTATTPAYSFNTSVPASTGAIVQAALATSTYSPIFGAVTTIPDSATLNLSAIPLIQPLPTVATYTVTDSAGMISTSVSRISIPSIVLGAPPGWSSAGFTVRAPAFTLLLSFVVLPSLLSLLLHCTSLDFS